MGVQPLSPECLSVLTYTSPTSTPSHGSNQNGFYSEIDRDFDPFYQIAK